MPDLSESPRTSAACGRGWPMPPPAPAATPTRSAWWPSPSTSVRRRSGPWSRPAAATWAKAARNSFGTARPPWAILPVRWHMIGHLQRNKVRRTVPLVDLIHSVNSPRLMARAGRTRPASAAAACRILLEVNISGEAAKDGLAAAAVEPFLPQLAGYRQLGSPRADVHGRPGGRPRCGPPRVRRLARVARAACGRIVRPGSRSTSFPWA